MVERSKTRYADSIRLVARTHRVSTDKGVNGRRVLISVIVFATHATHAYALLLFGRQVQATEGHNSRTGVRRLAS